MDGVRWRKGLSGEEGIKRKRGGQMGTEGARVSVRVKAASCSNAENKTLEEDFRWRLKLNMHRFCPVGLIFELK